MATNLIQEGKQIYTATANGLKAGAPYVLGNHQPCVLLTDAEAASPYNATVQTYGVFDLPVEAESNAIAIYAPLFYDATDGQLNDDGSNNKFFGVALEAVDNGDTETIQVLLAGKPYVPASITATELATNSVITAKILAKNVTAAKIALADGKLLVGGADGASAEKTPTGDVTITNEGVTAIGANKVLSSMVEPGLIKTATVAISNAEIKAINATPKELVAAPGANKMIEFLGAVLFHNYGSNALTGNHDITIGLDSGSVAVAAVVGYADFPLKEADHVYAVKPALAFNDAAADVLNKNLALTAAGDFAGNAGADTVWSVVVSYRIVTLS
jgi:predicted RecA/RadA family phage recombinase